MAVLRTSGKARRNEPIPWFGVLGIIAAISILAIGHSYLQRRDLGVERERILRERATLTAEIEADRTRISRAVEQWTVALAADPWAGDASLGGATEARDRPALYLRISAKEAHTTASVHEAAALGTLDGLSGCLLRGTAGGPWPYGEVVARSEMLGPTFVDGVTTASNDLRLRALSATLASYARSDWRVARDAWKRAEFAVLAVDEVESKGAIRLSMRRLADGAEILRVRRTPGTSIVAIQALGQGSGPNELARAQAIGCTLATEALALARP
jgi:hypothetical protein